ncbi:Uu.00g118610.m01.CDS01 [Anthostomella pinea]|uniref:Uu.00g118610.m01.CDS01 n=1 Tax=Anthostomella pinea TaxID=933095 RepID=A0AAI8VGH7_9PEZI|nr:Uu.00g118610.m01.CDS01 [Anthostomella pinea]
MTFHGLLLLLASLTSAPPQSQSQIRSDCLTRADLAALFTNPALSLEEAGDLNKRASAYNAFTKQPAARFEINPGAAPHSLEALMEAFCETRTAQHGLCTNLFGENAPKGYWGYGIGDKSPDNMQVLLKFEKCGGMVEVPFIEVHKGVYNGSHVISDPAILRGEWEVNLRYPEITEIEQRQQNSGDHSAETPKHDYSSTIVAHASLLVFGLVKATAAVCLGLAAAFAYQLYHQPQDVRQVAPPRPEAAENSGDAMSDTVARRRDSSGTADEWEQVLKPAVQEA